jgi:aspartate racemase
VVLAVIEHGHGEVGGLPPQDWPLRVTLVYRREGSDWRLALVMPTLSRTASRSSGRLRSPALARDPVHRASPLSAVFEGEIDERRHGWRPLAGSRVSTSDAEWGRAMHIGLIGGIGVAATVVYYQRLVAAVMARQASKLELTIVHGDIQELIRNNLADRRVDQARAFLPLVERLKHAGCDCAALTSLGAHFCFDDLAHLSPLPLVSGTAPLDGFFVERGIKRIGLLGTRVVMRTRLYGQLTQTKAMALDDEIETLGQTYQDIAVAGTCAPSQRELLLEAGRRMISAGADAVVLAGTDLNLAFDGRDPGYPVIDALDVHVDLLADLASERKPLGFPG